MDGQNTTFLVAFKDPNGVIKSQWAIDEQGALNKAVDIATGRMGDGKLSLERIFSVTVEGVVTHYELWFDQGRMQLREAPQVATNAMELYKWSTQELVSELLARQETESLVIQDSGSVVISHPGTTIPDRTIFGPAIIMVQR